MGTDFQYGLGQLDPTSFDVSQSNPASNVWIVKINYDGGNDARQFDITFTYDGANQQPSLTYSGESPTKDYVSSKLPMSYCRRSKIFNFSTGLTIMVKTHYDNL